MIHKIILSIVTLGIVSACSETPGRLMGIPQTAPYIYTENAAKSAEYNRQVTTAKRRSEQFFGRPSAPVNYIFCEDSTCDARFGMASERGKGPIGKAFGDQMIIVSSVGATIPLLAHEQAHVDMFAYTAGRGAILARLPAWFNEGMAEFVSLGPPKRMPANLGQYRDVMALRDPNEFKMAVTITNFQNIYGGAYFLVADIERKLGRAGLLNVLSEVAQGGRLETILDGRMGTDWPR